MFSADTFRTTEDFREAIYGGSIFRLPATTETRALVADIRSLLEQDFGALASVHTRFDFTSMKQPLSVLRAKLTTEPRYTEALAAIAAVAGVPAELAFDPLRLRCVLPGNHLNKGSEVAYAAHRDTWYGNPQAQVNFWIPLQDMTEAQSFMFFPDVFKKAVPNTSNTFQYDDWIDQHGWQGSKSHAPVAFPAPLQTPANGRAFSAQAGDIIVFSAAHLHQTVKNNSDMARFSLDFRAVHLADHAARRGAPNVDNASAPGALRDYLFPRAA
ncbi:MAG: hypothetical protein EPN97_04650 [Alphaproteobacteria bacterium]|nr:MAG: hypothetical protein EPN97_04650 [Alphaproteobacteria bacterium]